MQTGLVPSFVNFSLQSHDSPTKCRLVAASQAVQLVLIIEQLRLINLQLKMFSKNQVASHISQIGLSV